MECSDTWLTIGKITGVHGLGGNLKVWSWAQSPDTFTQGLAVVLKNEGDPQDLGREYIIIKTGRYKKGVLLTLEGVSTREASEGLVGKLVLVDKTNLPDLDEDTWYWQDLIGLTVVDTCEGKLGKVAQLFPTGADDILVVTDKTPQGKQEVLIPMNAAFVKDVNLDTGVITTELPEGFITD
ncbi:16S rRNA processing protein RimM [Desulfobacter hydrogenophilus]|uniref:Ribosome maturation factor RimM n=1 Tax=Desulfobacter hydrogenophilus TaxID=2291 RepID=A0A328FFC8_9BACT|nr:ribosome maturation factor RimM [Desulfobacter hydrogenophilus]NDY70537.1 16S rRNA processing protein RimM [Desulfobacter hydrogenophilus]QBH13910.1 16S rRNA processing protein RimM [Desulfobacter hydrogenophilus]RAM02142.1 16S rRNA processing protein RimM [Desulfobacter hydrogenophilus]